MAEATSLNIKSLLTLAGIDDEDLNKKVERALVAYAAASAGYKLGKKFLEKRKKKEWYSITVNDTDKVYRRLVYWMSENKVECKATTLATEALWGIPSGKQKPEWIYDFHKSVEGKVTQRRTIDGHPIRVSLETVSDEDQEGVQLSGSPYADASKVMNKLISGKNKRIRFEAKTEAGIEAAEEFIKETAKSMYSAPKGNPSISIAKRYGEFAERGDLPSRSLDTVILAEGQKERIINDIQSFLDDQYRYNNLGIPYHRGYLFCGPPGTGKTSIAKAIATHFEMNLYYIPLGDVLGDGNLFDLVGQVPARSILLLEDIDVFSHAHDRLEGGEDDGMVSLSGLLNSLDGIATPHGLITIMTSNNPDVLDPALLRPGRIDMVEHIDAADADQVAGMFNLFYDRVPENIKGKDFKFIPSDVIEIMKRNFNDPDNAAEELLTRV